MAEPQRTCHACRRSFPQGELLRFVRGPQGRAVLDLRGGLPGRGAYLCPRLACLRRGVKPKGVGGALGCGAPEESPEGLRDHARVGLSRMLREAIGHAHRAGAVVYGADRVGASLDRGEAGCVVTATDAAERTRSDVAERVAPGSLMTALSKAELGEVLGTAEVGVLAITHPSLAERIRMLALRWNCLREENGDGQG